MSSSSLKPPTTYMEQLSAVPVQNTKATRVPESTDKVWLMDVGLDHGKTGIMAKWFKLGRSRRYQLEGMGLSFYKQIDGERSLLEFVRDYQRDHHLSFFEARGIVLEYAKMLTQRGLIVLVVPELKKPDDAIDEP